MKCQKFEPFSWYCWSELSNWRNEKLEFSMGKLLLRSTKSNTFIAISSPVQSWVLLKYETKFFGSYPDRLESP